MDKAADERQIQSDIEEVEHLKNHPVIKERLQANRDSQEALFNILTSLTINSMETFFAHFEAIGHLRALRQEATFLDFKLAELKAKKQDL